MKTGQRSAIVRAEVVHGSRRETTCAVEMTEESIVVISDTLPPVDDIVVLQLSFPRVVRPLVCAATVSQVRMAGGPGAPPGFVATFLFDDDAHRIQIAEMARRLRPSSGPLPNCELSVLLVEDNQLLRDTFAYAFERYFRQRSARIRLTQAATADAAWPLARPDTNLVLVDHNLRGAPGTTLIARLRADDALGCAFIVGMSGAGTNVRSAMHAAGADLFLTKPIVLKDLFCTLEFMVGTPTRSDYGSA